MTALFQADGDSSKRARSSSGGSSGEKGGKEERRREEKKMKKHKHKDRSRSRERPKEKEREKKRAGSPEDEDEKRRNKMKKFMDAGHDVDLDNMVVGVKRGCAFPSSGNVIEHDNLDGPQCPKCDQICKDNANMKNHLLSHYYTDFYRVTPDQKPYACPTCGKENRDRITMIRHFAFSHGMLFELTDVTPEMLNAACGSSKLGSKGPRPVIAGQYSGRVKRMDDDSDDDDKRFKERIANIGQKTDRNSEQLKSSFGKHSKDHKHKKEKKHKEKDRDETEEERRIRKEKKHKEKKKDETEDERRRRKEKERSERDKGKKSETEEERRIRKDRERSEKDKERRGSKDSSNPLSSMLKELTPDSPAPSPAPRRIAHKPDSRSPSPEPEVPSREEKTPQADTQADESDDDDFGDLPTPVFAE